MKSFEVTAFFPRMVPAHQAFQSCTVDAGNLARAAQRGLLLIKKRPACRRKRLYEVQLTVKLFEGGKRQPGDADCRSDLVRKGRRATPPQCKG